MRVRGTIIAASALALAACQPPAADDYLERGFVEEKVPEASPPLPSPDSEDAVWAPSDQPGRLLYGTPGETPLMAVQCVEDGDAASLRFTRFVRADREAQAMLSLVGNFHTIRLPVDATYNGRAWLWQGEIEADTPQLEALTGRREIEAVIPGAGAVLLKPGEALRELVNRCRSRGQPSEDEEPSEPDE